MRCIGAKVQNELESTIAVLTTHVALSVERANEILRDLYPVAHPRWTWRRWFGEKPVILTGEQIKDRREKLATLRNQFRERNKG
jgi:hypothetical protein